MKSAQLLCFLLSFSSLIACKSVSKANESKLSSIEVEQEIESFASLGHRRISSAYEKLQASLLKLPKDFSLEQVGALSRELIELKDMLEIFVHLFPIRNGEDKLLKLHTEILEGLELSSELTKATRPAMPQRQSEALLNYATRMTAAEHKQWSLSFLESFNRTYASRRSIPVLDATCWAKVDFIPRLNYPAEEELHDFMKALLKATQTEARETMKLEEITAVEQATPFQSTRRKSKDLLMLQSYFPEIASRDDELSRSLGLIRELSRRYEVINQMLEERAKLLLQGKSSLSLDKKILKEWTGTKDWQAKSLDLATEIVDGN